MLCLAVISTATQKFHRTFYINSFSLGVMSQQSCLLVTLPSALLMISEHFLICLFIYHFLCPIRPFFDLYFREKEKNCIDFLYFIHSHFKILLHLLIFRGHTMELIYRQENPRDYIHYQVWWQVPSHPIDTF